MNNQNSILIIGGPNAGKTHFGGQLFGRLNNRKGKYRITSTPSDLTIFQEVLDKLCEGKSAGHTEASANRHLELKIIDDKQKVTIIAFPDYAGEQVKMIVDNRRINKIWKDYISSSSSWMLFIRLEEIKIIEDLINRGLPTPDLIRERQSKDPPIDISDSASFVELLQTLLYFKSISTLNKIKAPKLTVVLSCWDLLKVDDDAIPSDLFKERLPLLYSFIKNTWEEESLTIIGLSSTEKTLTEEADEDYIEKGPENFGYLITSDGKKEKDLTLSIETFIGQR